jgi:hypothetical protein
MQIFKANAEKSNVALVTSFSVSGFENLIKICLYVRYAKFHFSTEF